MSSPSANFCKWYSGPCSARKLGFWLFESSINHGIAAQILASDMSFLKLRTKQSTKLQRTARVPVGTRVYAIGDVHGEGLLLHSLLGLVRDDLRYRPAHSVHLIFLGDLIDRGPHSATILRSLYALNDPNVIVLKGNHEEAFISSYYGDDDALKFWLAYGGRTTLESFGIESDEPNRDVLRNAMKKSIEPEIMQWLLNMPTSYTVGDYFFAHAGIRPGVPLDEQSDNDLLWIREPFLESAIDHGKVIVHGHTISDTVTLGANRICLDTGAHEHRKLTALGLEGADQWLLQASGRDTKAMLG